MPYSDDTKAIQQLLVDKFHQDIDVDGIYGFQTGRAILNTLQSFAQGREDDQARQAAENERPVGKLILKGVPHISQWDYPHIEILPQREVEEKNPDGSPKLDDEGKPIIKVLAPETCRDYGCMSCCVELLRAYYAGDTPNIEWFIAHMKEIDGYNDRGWIRWGKVKEAIGLQHTSNIGIEAGITQINVSRPVILEIRTKEGRTHYILGIGYDPKGFHCNDVGSWRGNAYENPGRTDTPGQTFVPYENVTRVDSMRSTKGA